MPKTKLKLIGAYVEPDVHEALLVWADDEGRSLSNLVGRLLAKAVQEKQQQQPQDDKQAS